MNFEVGPTLFAEGLSVTPFGYSMLAIFDFFYASAMVAHLRATFMSPGYTPKLPVPEGIPLGQARTCRYCNQWKPDRTYHCRTCKRCIHRMDHHCPWINNCIGAKNQKSFCLFLLYACLCCLQVVTLMIYFLYFSPEDQNFSGGLISLLVVVSTAVIATIFLVFTTILFYIQIRGVITGQTTVEQKMKKSAKAQPILDNLKMTFGNNVFNWLNPLADSPDPNYSEILYPTSDLLKQQ